MSQVNLNSSVGSWVAAYPQVSRIFESLQIDYCCGGERSLEQACRDRGLDPREIVQQFEQAISDDGPSPENWLDAPLAELCDHIEQTHHAYLKRELPRLAELVAKVAQAHAENHPELTTIQQVFASLRAELEPHMFKEEHILFPAIRKMEQSSGDPRFPFGSVANPIRMMEYEHDNAGAGLERIHSLTGGYAVAPDACNSYRAMLDGLRQLEQDMHQHVHKENNILFPRAIQLEAARTECGHRI